MYETSIYFIAPNLSRWEIRRGGTLLRCGTAATRAAAEMHANALKIARGSARVTFPCVVGFVAGCAAGAVLKGHSGLWALALAAIIVPLMSCGATGTLRSRRQAEPRFEGDSDHAQPAPLQNSRCSVRNEDRRLNPAPLR
jgi:hypothetical protein